MISAYGGIRWDMIEDSFNMNIPKAELEEHLGNIRRDTENSPIYNIDKINTPLLIMHNDADGHVPWYQGIEFS